MLETALLTTLFLTSRSRIDEFLIAFEDQRSRSSRFRQYRFFTH